MILVTSLLLSRGKYEVVSIINTNQVKIGLWGGLIGGFVFGLMMTIIDVLPMVAMLVGSTSAGVGFIVHMIFSAIIGILFVATLRPIIASVGSIAAGLMYGFLWWVLGPLLIMPILLGMGSQLSIAGMQAALPSLLGHLVYGFILGITYLFLASPIQSTDAKSARKSAA